MVSICVSACSTYHETDIDVTRGVPHLQILKIPQPRHAIPHKPRMLPYYVRIVCRQDLLSRAELVSGGRL